MDPVPDLGVRSVMRHQLGPVAEHPLTQAASPEGEVVLAVVPEALRVVKLVAADAARRCRAERGGRGRGRRLSLPLGHQRGRRCDGQRRGGEGGERRRRWEDADGRLQLGHREQLVATLCHQQVRPGTGVGSSTAARLPLLIAVVHLVPGQSGTVRKVPAAAATLERFLARVLPPVRVQFVPRGERLGARAAPEHGRGRSQVRLQLCVGLEDELAHRALRAVRAI